ncbi:MAG: glycosyltransferase family 2 protein [Nitrospiraceae bacterium]|nr:glycosyltransferase family 2 protein [Nitrospiraceae bacterium]
MQINISFSIVLYKPDRDLLFKTLRSLETALLNLPLSTSVLYIIDNSPENHITFEATESFQVVYIKGHGNIGFGQGHNLAISKTNSDFHLILNPDVEIAFDGLNNALEFFSAHPECGLIVPAVFDRTGQRQYLCKRYPSILILALRGLAPQWLRKIFHKQLDYFEMRDVISNNVVWDLLLVSGCFMFFRTDVIKKLGGFDKRFFMYFEDSDLSIRAKKIVKIAYIPSVKIKHYGGYAAKKGFKHIIMFARSAVTFFRIHGWKFF